MKVLSDSVFLGMYLMYSYKCIKNLNKNVSIFQRFVSSTEMQDH